MSRFIPLVVLSCGVLLSTLIWWAEPFGQRTTENSPVSSQPAPEPSKSATADPAASQETSPTTPLETTQPAQAESAPGERSVGKDEPTARTDLPQAVIEQTTHDFGVLPRFTQSHHDFVIRNEGTAPLTLKQGPSSCSCTILGLEQSEVQPGEEVVVKLEWTLKFKEGPFRQSAVIYTNDPQRKEIELVVEGLTETRLGLSEPSIVFSSLKAGETATKEVFLYSRTWKSLEAAEYKVKADIPGMQVELLPASPEDAPSLEARALRKIRLKLPSDLEPGHHVGQVVLTVPNPEQKPDSEETSEESVTLSIEAGVRKPGVKFFSPQIDGYGRVKWGAISGSQGSETLKLNFRVDQGDTPWSATKFDSYPQFLDVQVVPLDEKVGLFQLQVQVPPGTPPGNFYGQQIGRIVIHSDHPLVPRIPTQRLGILLEFHVD